MSKKIKKPEPIVASEIDEDEIPFEIPENWCWCRLEDLVTILGDGLHGTPQYDISGEYYFVNGNNLNNGVIEIKPDTKKINEKEFEKYKKDLNETTIFVSINGTIGNIAFYNNEKIILGKSACYFNVAIEDLKKYFFYLFQTDFFLNYALDNATGTTIKNVGLGTMRNFLLPLPPLSVQNAIVEKLEQVLPLVDAYENALLQKEELKSALPDKIKKAILQEAITGQLTENWRKSATIKESGKQLLYRIIEERNAKALAEWEEKVKTNPKAKKPVPVVASEIEEEEIPFEVPESWCWCRWGELSELIQYGYNAPAKESGRIKMVRITDIQNGKVQWNTVPFCEISDTDIQVYQLRKNDILFARTGGTVGKSFLVDEEPENAVFAGYLIRTQYDDKKLNPKYMKMFMESQIYWDQLKNGTIATAQPNCNGQTLSKMILPLPPLTEQQEIVKKVEELLELCK
ncbi:MAG: restriction endonuclease subunit S [Spirochaetales bacterium]|nr:restriction endonuclease subunit S [Spirochaetales bacterium]MDY5916645.1 restriction endonuclease subunit S [Treponema sp.]